MWTPALRSAPISSETETANCVPPYSQIEFSFDAPPDAPAPAPVPPTGPKRTFLGWDKPLLHVAVDHLTRDWKDGLLDLSDRMIVVSTRQAGRRLREALSARAAEKNAAVLPPLVTTPEALVTPDLSSPVAGQAELLRVWSDVLQNIRLVDYPRLFPVDPAEQSFAWALQTAADLLTMRTTLGEAGMTIADVANQPASESWREPERWRDLARLERQAQKRLDEIGLRDPQRARNDAAANKSLPDDTKKVIVLGVPDPNLLVIKALKRHAESHEVEIAIRAPADLAEAFTDWGVPKTESWMRRIISIPEPDSSIHLAPDPPSSARLAADLLAKHPSPAETAAFSICDENLVALLAKECDHREIATYDPAGYRFELHELAHLFRILVDLLGRRAFSAFSEILRVPDMLNALARAWSQSNDEPLRRSALLAGCDALHEQCLPDTIDDAHDAYTQHRAARLPGELGFAIAEIQRQLAKFRKAPFVPALTGFLRFVYGERNFAGHVSEDRAFVELTSALTSILEEFEGAAFKNCAPLTPSDALDLLLRVLSRERVADEREPHAIDLQGWLEAPWEDASHLILAGFNDRLVPEAIVGDPFLPASARETLGLRTNDDRFVRDVFYLSAILASRVSGGQVDFVLSRARDDGEPLRPSRLLFQCEDDELPDRALRLFEGAPAAAFGQPSPWTPAWRLAPPAFPEDHKITTQLRVTDFSTYLLCPFRFYLKRALGMEPVDARKLEMDFRDFGTLCHAALEKFGFEESLRDSTDGDEISDFLSTSLEDLATAKYGSNLPAPVIIQLDAARQRLAAAGRIFAEQRARGWRIEGDPEWQIHERLDFRIGGLVIRGTIDRIEKHEKTGDVRVLDFKTSAKPSKAEFAHLATFGRFESPEDYPEWSHTENSEGKACRWVNLQVPLYLIALRQHFGDSVSLSGGYFNLPRAIGETGIDLWDSLTGRQLAGAESCAQGVVEAIQNRQFWPPRQRPRYDDFSGILFGIPEDTAMPPLIA